MKNSHEDFGNLVCATEIQMFNEQDFLLGNDPYIFLFQ